MAWPSGMKKLMTNWSATFKRGKPCVRMVGRHYFIISTVRIISSSSSSLKIHMQVGHWLQSQWCVQMQVLAFYCTSLMFFFLSEALVSHDTLIQIVVTSHQKVKLYIRLVKMAAVTCYLTVKWPESGVGVSAAQWEKDLFQGRTKRTWQSPFWPPLHTVTSAVKFL